MRVFLNKELPETGMKLLVENKRKGPLSSNCDQSNLGNWIRCHQSRTDGCFISTFGLTNSLYFASYWFCDG